MKKTKTKTAPKPSRPTASIEETPFAPIAKAFSADKNVTLGGRFGAESLKTGGRTFAMLVKGKLVVKLPQERVAVLVVTGIAEQFDPGHGRLMKEWAALTDHDELWLALAQEAHAFVTTTLAPKVRKNRMRSK